MPWFLRHHSEALREARAGRAVPRFIHQSHGPLELALICPAQHGGGWPGWRGRDAAWTLGVSRAGSPKPHQVGDSREGSQERPCRPAAGCLSLSYTMSDGEGPSAGEWQRYIYPPQVRLQSQGHRLQGALPPSPGCRQLCGWIPCLLA